MLRGFYSRVSGLQSFPPPAKRSRGLRQSLHDRKVKENCKFEFCLNCKQRLTFHLGAMSDNRFISVDAA